MRENLVREQLEDATEEAQSRVTGKLFLLVHGLCLSDLQWKRNGHDHGAVMAYELGYTALYPRYNSGLHVSENGRLLADLLETLVEQWSVRVQELAIVGHSMGGLVSRSAFYYSAAVGHHWPRHMRQLIFLGTPHHGATLEQVGNWVNTKLEISPCSAPIACLGRFRSAGITDLCYGNVLEDDWKGRDRFAANTDLRTPALPSAV